MLRRAKREERFAHAPQSRERVSSVLRMRVPVGSASRAPRACSVRLSALSRSPSLRRFSVGPSGSAATSGHPGSCEGRGVRGAARDDDVRAPEVAPSAPADGRTGGRSGSGSGSRSSGGRESGPEVRRGEARRGAAIGAGLGRPVGPVRRPAPAPLSPCPAGGRHGCGADAAAARFRLWLRPRLRFGLGLGFGFCFWFCFGSGRPERASSEPGPGALAQKNETVDHLISLSGAVQLRHLSNNLETLLKRDFLKLLPLELSFYLLKWLDPQTLLTGCLVSKQWNKVISACTEVWQTACKNLGWQIDDSVQDALHWKKVYLKAILRMKQLEDHEAFETSSLIGHSARVYALYYKDGLLCTGSDDLSAKLWDVSTGQCVYGIQTHTCAAVKFDEQKLVTGSFDNTVACWDWSSGARTQHFRGHTGAVFSVDYNDELDILVSGSADFTVKVWALSAGTCLNTLTGHTEWVTKVVLQKCKVKSLLHSPGDYILLSADKYEIKIWPIGREINCKCLKTLSVSEDRSICLQPRLHFDGKYIVCSSALGLYQWDFASYDILRVIKTPEVANLALLGFGDVFALLFDNRYLYIMDLRTESLISRWPLPEYRKSKRGSSFLAGEASWLNGLDGHNDAGLVFATSMPDHSIHLVLWKEHG